MAECILHAMGKLAQEEPQVRSLAFRSASIFKRAVMSTKVQTTPSILSSTVL